MILDLNEKIPKVLPEGAVELAVDLKVETEKDCYSCHDRFLYGHVALTVKEI